MTDRLSRLFLALILTVSQIPTVCAENLNLTTFYPVPSGVYKNLTTTQGANFAVTSGNVGVGTELPSFKFDVYPPSNARIGAAEIGSWPLNPGVAYFGHQTLDHSIAGNYAVLQNNVGATFINTALGFPLTFTENNVPTMAIQQGTGNVGIGTASPVYKLDVAGNLNLNRGIGIGAAMFVNNAEALWFNGSYFSWGYGGNANFFADNVGIGTPAPETTLHLYANSNIVTPTILLENDSAGGSAGTGVYMRDTNNRSSSLAYYPSPQIFALDAPNMVGQSIRLSFGGIPALTVFAGGSVSIGTPAPDAKLDVRGLIHHEGIAMHSSRSLKTDIEKLSAADYVRLLSEVEKLDIYRFKYKNSDNKRMNLGLIAEETPAMLLDEKNNAVYEFDYITMLAGALKAQQKLINDLQKEIVALKTTK